MREMVMLPHKSPSLFGYPVDARDRFHEDVVRDSSFRDPDSAEQVYPVTMHGLFEGAPFVRTQHTGLNIRQPRIHGVELSPTTGFSGDTVHFLHSH